MQKVAIKHIRGICNNFLGRENFVRNKKVVSSKNITLGGNTPISVQTMLKGSFTSYSVEDLYTFKCYGCDILRFSIKGDYDKDKLKYFIKSSPLPLVLDIKNIKEQALDALKFGIDAIRINPCLLTKSDIVDIIKAAKDNNAIIRIGTNDGSIKDNSPIDEILRTIKISESLSFNNLVLSVKSSNPKRTNELYKELDCKSDYPLHVGLTESGDTIGGCVRSTIVLAELLKDGVGDTIRYSLSGDEKSEIRAGGELLSNMGMRESYLNLIICPSCDRATFNTGVFYSKICDELFRITYEMKKKITLAIMGCVLNGVGEGKSADLGISGSDDKVIIFKKGEIVDKVNYESLSITIKEHLKNL